LNREYAFKKGTALVPTFTAMAVVNLLEKNFETLLDFDFTARLEDDLDAISRGEQSNQVYLNAFYNGNEHPGLKELVALGEKQVDPREVCGLPLGIGPDDRPYEVRIGRYGPFLSDGERRTSVPEGIAPDEMTIAAAMELLSRNNKEAQSLGGDPETGLPIYLKAGPYGPYVQLGDPIEGEKKKPKMASLLPGMSETTLTLEEALKLLTLPRTLGKHPETGHVVVVSNGRFGPYVKCHEDTRSVPLAEMSPLDMTFEDALKLLSQPKARGRQAGVAKSLRDLGPHPTSAKELSIKAGRYGPYVSDGEVNASLPKGRAPETLSMEEAVELLSARAAKILEEGGLPAKKKSRTAAKPKQKKAAEPVAV